MHTSLPQDLARVRKAAELVAGEVVQQAQRIACTRRQLGLQRQKLGVGIGAAACLVRRRHKRRRRLLGRQRIPVDLAKKGVAHDVLLARRAAPQARARIARQKLRRVRKIGRKICGKAGGRGCVSAS